MKTSLELESIADSGLVQLCLRGDREAFAQMVARYQSVVCAIAYSACGDVGRSEDLAQETFVAAWRKLGELREPGKLKSWLCGIARNLVNNSVRAQQRVPTARAGELSPETCSGGASPREMAITNEEEALMWRALETMPPDYREPMVLYYREGRSAEKVAAALELTEEAVRQRLSRGRIMLNERVAKTVESALLRSGPGRIFTLSVLGAVSALSVSAKAAAVGATAAKGGATAKAAAMTGFSGAILAALLIVLGNYAGYRMSLDAAYSDEERRRIKSIYRSILAFACTFFVAFAALVFWGFRRQEDHAFPFGLLVSGLIVIYLLTLFVFVMATFRRRRKYLASVLARAEEGDSRTPAWEYRSRFEFLGLPLAHICIGDRFSVLKKPVRAWIAIGDCAIGGLFAFGGIAVAPVSIGGFAIGLLPFGGLAAGILAVGGTALGVWTFGGMTLGWQAFGGMALAWNTAVGGIALAHDYALGGVAHAMQANTETAMAFVRANPFFRDAQAASNYCIWFNLVWVVPMIIQWRIIARSTRIRRQKNGD